MRLRGEGGWKARRGPHLGIMICNHSCSTVQCLPSQALAPEASPDDASLHLVVVRPLRLPAFLRFLIFMQWSNHLTLPRVEYFKVCRYC